MILRKHPKTLERSRLLRWARLTGQLGSYIQKVNIEKDLLLGGECIIDIDGLLKYMETIPGELFDDVSNKHSVYYECVEVYYDPDTSNKQLKKTDII